MNNENSKQVHLAQMQLAYPHMNHKSYVLCDDTFRRHNSPNWDGKCGYVLDFLFERGWRIYACAEAPDSHWLGFVLLEN